MFTLTYRSKTVSDLLQAAVKNLLVCVTHIDPLIMLENMYFTCSFVDVFPNRHGTNGSDLKAATCSIADSRKRALFFQGLCFFFNNGSLWVYGVMTIDIKIDHHNSLAFRSNAFGSVSNQSTISDLWRKPWINQMKSCRYSILVALKPNGKVYIKLKIEKK